MKKVFAATALLVSILAAPAFAGGYMAAAIVGANVEFNQYSMVSLMGQDVTVKVNVSDAFPFHMQDEGATRQIAVVL